LERRPALLKREQPDLLVLELGGKDGLRGFPFKRSQQNLATMIEMAHAQDIEVLLIGVRLPTNLGPAYNRRFQQMYEGLAQDFEISYLARFLENVAASAPDLMQSDGIHPTAKAQPILADKVYRKLLPMLASSDPE
jgi:acyl-CoA thioesterase-1